MNILISVLLKIELHYFYQFYLIMVFDKKAYREKNKEKIKEQNKEYYEKNKEKIKEKNKEFYENNKAYMKEYYQTEQGKKSYRISHWKGRGVISNDYDALYNQYINTSNCENCNVELTEDRYITPTTRCLDHEHTTGEFRNILCNMCNIKRG